LFGVTKALPHKNIEYYEKWINNGYYAGMTYLSTQHLEQKRDPANLLSNAKSILCFGASYNSNIPYSFERKNKPIISRYALNKDYHIVLEAKLNNIISATKIFFDIDFNYRICVDSSPLLERSYCADAGFGWIGKNGCLINRRLGSFFFVAEVLVDIEFDTKESLYEDRCGNCRKCIDTCPTNAIVDDKTIDARKCISYIMIENKTDIPQEFIGKTNGFVFGCDICQEACPWNNIIVTTRMKEFMPKKEIIDLDWETCEKLTEDDFNHIFKDSPVKRAKYEGFMRNVRFNLTNKP